MNIYCNEINLYLNDKGAFAVAVLDTTDYCDLVIKSRPKLTFTIFGNFFADMVQPVSGFCSL